MQVKSNCLGEDAFPQIIMLTSILTDACMSFPLLIAARQSKAKERNAVCKCCVHRISDISQYCV